MATSGELRETTGLFRRILFHWREWCLGAALVLAVFLAYQPAWQGGFLWDDDAHVTRPDLRSWTGLYRIWFDLDATQQYYPFLHTAFWVQHKLWGDHPLGYHLVNLLLHATAALMVAWILRLLGVPGAYLAAAIFALHPIEVESVAWITELKNTLSAVFYLAAAAVYLRFDETREPWPWRYPTAVRYVTALLLFVLGLLSKTVTATLPAALLVVFWWRRGRLAWKRDVLPLLPFFVLAAGFGLLTAWDERTLIGAEGEGFDLTVVQRCLIAGHVVCFYLGKLVWPTGLIFIYPRWQINPAAAWQYLFPAAALVLLVAAWAVRGRSRGPLAGVLFYVGTLFPVLGFCNVYPFIFSFVADHFQYLAGLGIIVLASAGIALALQRWGLWRHPVGYAISLGLLGTLAVLTWQQAATYANVETLYRTVLRDNPNCWMAYHNLGVEWAKQGRYAAAIENYEQTIALKPDCAPAYLSLAAALIAEGKYDEGIAQYHRAIKVKPKFARSYNDLGRALEQHGKAAEAISWYEKAVEIDPKSAIVRVNLAVALRRLGRYDDAVASCRAAVMLQPWSARAHLDLGRSLYDAERVRDAVREYQAALDIDPDNADAHASLGAALDQQQRPDEAAAQYQQALDLKPDCVDAYVNWGASLEQQGKLSEAAEKYRQALEIQPECVDALIDLGVVLRRQGKLDQAIEHYQKALKLQPENVDAHVNLGAALGMEGLLDEAAAHFRKALETNPNHARGKQNLQLIVTEQNRSQDALKQQRALLRRRPDDLVLLNNTAWLLATSPFAAVRNAAEAVALAEKAVKLSGGKQPAILSTLAAAYAEAKRFPDARATAQKALILADVQHKSKLVESLRAKLQLYDSGAAYREMPAALAPKAP